MQTGKFTIFDYDKLQDSEKQEHYSEIIKVAHSNSLQLSERQINNYSKGTHRITPNLNISYYLQRANEIIQSISNTPKVVAYYPTIRTANEKMLFITSFVFPNDQKFINTLTSYGIDKESCIHFGEEIKTLKNYSKEQATVLLDNYIKQYFPNLILINQHYATKNTGVIVNKILEIAYLHPELLKQKEKS